MNWRELIDYSFTVFPHKYHSDRGLMRQFLKEAEEEMAQEAGLLERQKWLYIASNADSVDLPVDLISLTRVEYKGNVLTRVQKANIPQLHKTDTTWIAHGTPTMYYLEGDKMFLYPGASGAGWLTLWYQYKPVVLNDSATAYKTLAYDALTAHFVRGEVVTGGTSGAVGTVEYDDNLRKTGTLTLSSISGTFQDDEALTGSSNGAATVNGTAATLSTAGDDPTIPVQYRRYMADYARSQFAFYLGLDDQGDYYMRKFAANLQSVVYRHKARGQFGPNRIGDVWGEAIG